VFAVVGLVFVASLRADEPKHVGKTFEVPFQLTSTQHVLVRAKINGKGPFNLIVDTGAPILIVSTPVGKKLGLQTEKGWTKLDRFELEGGVVLTQFKALVETPFQLEGMNGMGLAGAELHGMIGYTVLANYKIEYDFTRDKMKWTRLDFKPPPPQPVGKAGAGQGGLEILGTLMRFLGFLSGAKLPELTPRGFLGVELAEDDGRVKVKSVLSKGPAAGAGLQAGDRIDRVQGKEVRSSADVHRRLAEVTAGQTVRLVVQRGDRKEEIAITAGEGL
jgi:hypothetical protein